METLERYFNARLAAFIDRTGISPTTFGMRAVGNPNLMRQIAAGRSLCRCGRRTGFWRSSTATTRTRTAHTLRRTASGAAGRKQPRGTNERRWSDGR